MIFSYVGEFIGLTIFEQLAHVIVFTFRENVHFATHVPLFDACDFDTQAHFLLFCLNFFILKLWLSSAFAALFIAIIVRLADSVMHFLLFCHLKSFNELCCVRVRTNAVDIDLVLLNVID